MKLTSSYTIELKHINKILNDTVKIYREALVFLIDVFHSEWEDLYLIKNNSCTVIIPDYHPIIYIEIYNKTNATVLNDFKPIIEKDYLIQDIKECTN